MQYAGIYIFKEMAIAIKKLQEKFFSKQKRRIIMFGLASSGKTSIIHKITPYKNITMPGLPRFSAARVCLKNIEYMVWDVPGLWNRRWENYIEKYCDAIIFVVDSSDHKRLSECESLLRDLVIGESLKSIPVALFVNKQDLPNAMSTSEVANALRIQDILRNHNYFVQGVSAKSGKGLSNGFDQLYKIFSKKKR